MAEAKTATKTAKGGKAAKAAKSEALEVGTSPAVPKGYKPRLRKTYEDEIRAKMIAEFGYKNPMEVPVIEKIVLNMGVGEAVNDTKKVTSAAEDLARIAGQKPVITKARKANRDLQGAREYADWRQSDAAVDAHVRVSRSSCDDRAAPRA